MKMFCILWALGDRFVEMSIYSLAEQKVWMLFSKSSLFLQVFSLLVVIIIYIFYIHVIVNIGHYFSKFQDFLNLPIFQKFI